VPDPSQVEQGEPVAQVSRTSLAVEVVMVQGEVAGVVLLAVLLDRTLQQAMLARVAGVPLGLMSGVSGQKCPFGVWG
jgi:hypothetical protein